MKFITHHPYWTAAIVIYLLLVYWMVRQMIKAPIHNEGDEIVFTDEN